MTLLGLVLLVAAVGLALMMAAYVNTFSAGFFRATIIWKWHSWIYKPMDAWLDRFWSQDAQS